MKFRVLIVTLFVFAYCSKSTEVKYVTGENGKTGAIIPASPNGATANLEGQLILNVAADSLQDPVDITIQKIPAPAAQNEIIPIAAAYEFGPEGTEFIRGNQATFCYNPEQLQAKGLSENTMQVYYLDPEGVLQSIGGDVDTVNHCVTASIEHFSTYVAAAYTTLAGGNTAPAITGTNWLPTTPVAGLPLRIRVTITDFDAAHNQGAIASAFVKYRMVGEATGSSFPHVLALTPDTADTSGQKFYAVIPASHVTLAGIEYRIDATDNFGAQKQLPSATPTAKSTRTVTRTVNTATPLKLSITTLNISSGFAKDIVVQGKDTGGTWRTLEPDSVMVGGGVGSTARWQPGSFRFTAGATGAGTVTAHVGAYSISAPVTVRNGTLQKIEILNNAGVIITTPILANLGEVISLDALGYDAYGNQVLITPIFATTGGVGSVTSAGVFTAAGSTANGTITATLAGLTDSVPVFVAVPTYSVGGTVSGLTTGTLVLQNNGGDDLSVGANGSFSFATKLFNGNSYAISVRTNPQNTICNVSQNTGSVGSTNVQNVAVTCVYLGPSVIVSNAHDYRVLESGFVIGTASDVINGLDSVEVQFDGGSYATAIGTTSWKFPLPTGGNIWRMGSVHTANFRAKSSNGTYSPVVTLHIKKGANKDFNGDGYADLATGAGTGNLQSLTLQKIDRVQINYGTPLGISPIKSFLMDYHGSPFTYQDPITLERTTTETGFGTSLTVADVNGDGFADLIVAAPGLSLIYVYHGQSSGFTSDGTSPDLLPAAEISTLGGSFYGMLATGDLNGDGYDDLIITGIQSAVILTFHGGPLGIMANTFAPGSSGPNSIVDYNNSAFAYNASISVGDLNGDGFSDIVYADQVNTHGRICIFNGGTNGITATTTAAGPNGPNGTVTGNSVAGITGPLALGDFNSDGFLDLAVGGSNLFIFHGSTSGITATTTASGPSGPNNSIFAHGDWMPGFDTLAQLKVGDFNGDGIDDLAISTYYAYSWGSAFVAHGSAVGIQMDIIGSQASGPFQTPPNTTIRGSWPLLTDPSQMSIGRGLAVADSDGDGFADLAIMGPYGIYFFKGKTGGITADTTVTSPTGPDISIKGFYSIDGRNPISF